MENYVTIKTSELQKLIEDSIRKVLEEYNFPQNSSRQHIYLDIKEASIYLEIPVSTLYQYTSDRSIPFFKRGKKLYFSPIELNKWMEDGRVKTRAQLSAEHLNQINQK